MVMTTVAVSGLVLLSACGGGDGSGKGDDIEGAKDGKKSASASPSSSASEDSDAPKFDLPNGVHTVFDDDDMTGDPKKDEVLRAHENAVKAMGSAYSADKPDWSVIGRYYQDSAGARLRANVKSYRAEGKVGTGTYRYYDRKVTVGKSAAAVTFCESQRDAFAKMVKTGKVVRTKPSLSDFTSAKDILEKRGNTWVVIHMTSKGSDEKCAR
ncbi:hypothetical protein ACTWQF_22070 [Streptomyces sp. 8N114]|uniref:hypothetical protein n=1 Tax=Streptomyces sp. 8N114 TaxID=3457419 RepID=UPI003FD5F94C